MIQYRAFLSDFQKNEFYCVKMEDLMEERKQEYTNIYRHRLYFIEIINTFLFFALFTNYQILIRVLIISSVCLIGSITMKHISYRTQRALDEIELNRNIK